MVEIFEGRLGGGKTYSATIRMVDHLRRGGTVITNVALKWEAVCEYVITNFGLLITPEQLRVMDGPEILTIGEWAPRGTRDLPVLVVIDEAHIWLGVRETMAKEKKAFADWITQTRKLSIDLIFIVQSASNLDVRVGRLIQYVWRFRDLSKWIIPGIGSFPTLCKVFTLGIIKGDMILQAQFDYDGKTLNDKVWMPKSKKIFALYDTDALLFDVGKCKEVIERKKLVRATNKEGNKKVIKYMVLVALVAVGISLYKLNEMRKHWSAPETKETASHVIQEDKTVRQAPAAPAAPTYSIVSEQLRYSDGVSVRTDVGEYQVGELSHLGFVEGIRGHVVRVRAPDGSSVFVLAFGSGGIRGGGAAPFSSPHIFVPPTPVVSALAGSLAATIQPQRK